MFEALPQNFSFPEAEKRVLEFWEQHNIFARSMENRHGAPRFVFYEGPPTANGMPHPGHCLTRAIKDLFPRYQTMCGKLVERKAGWDTHGLPVEVEVCKELGIHTKEEIEAYGVEKFNRKCIESVFRYTREWEYLTRRLGFWVNLEEAYVTFHQQYVESVWWSLKTLFERGLLYQGHKVVWWWAQGGTALSAGEVGEGYRTVQDPSVYVRFPLREGTEARRHEGTQGGARSASEEMNRARSASEGQTEAEKLLAASKRISLLVWTTTPWTLISNHFAAVAPEIDYAIVHDKAGDEYFVIAEALVGDVAQRIKRELPIVARCKGEVLLGLRYTPPFDAYARALDARSAPLSAGGSTPVAWRVVAADFVELGTGTGIVHIAPAYGEVDFNLLQDERKKCAGVDAIPLLNAVAPNGNFNDDAPAAYRGRWVKDCDKDIIRELRERGVLLHQETIEHEYPFCPRSPDDALIQYARQSWFVRTSQFRDEFLANNAKVKWLPDHIQEGRFGDFLRNNVDWALSRERYWGTPLPIWVCEKTGKMEAVGSLAELMAKPGATDGGLWEQKKKDDPALPDHLRVHKPYIDAWTYDSPFVEAGTELRATEEVARRRHGGTKGAENRETGTEKPRMRRVTEVIDCWWDAGSMPFAQWGFPHASGSVETFRQRFPADFISEAIDQTRGWFYGLLSISTLLFGPGSIAVPAVRDAANKPVVTAGLSKRRRILPHWEAGGSTYVLTFRVLSGELAPEERTIVLNACRHWDELRALVHAVVVMPDHVHMLLTPLEKSAGKWWSLAELMHSIKGFTSHEINARRGAAGDVWQREYFDRIIRSEGDFDEKLNYIITNPARRGLPEDYAWVWVEPTHAASHRRDGDAPRDADASHRRDGDAPRDADASHRRDGDAPRSPFPHPYRACIVLGHMMGEDGNKMSKRLRNYKEPSFVFDTYGADAMRWYFFSAQVPWTSTRFVEAGIRDAHREFLVRLYNVFSFFNIYANIDGFIAHPTEGSPWRPTAERGELDRWIISELMRTIAFVREKLDAFENYPAAGRINEFVDALSNWYVRRSRDRFWKGEKDQDKWDAYHTLYGVLFELSKLIAPFTPFFAEFMYQNLTGAEAHVLRGTETRRHEGASGGDAAASALHAPMPSCPGALSVHLCDYPEADGKLIDEQLAAEMDIVRDIVSLGRAARTAAKLKVRQPLGLCEIVLAKREHAEWLEDHRALIAEELNIKQVEFSTEADHYVSYQIKADFKAIGPKFGKLAPQVGAAVQKLDPAEARKSLESAGAITVYVGNEAVRLTSAEVQVQLAARPGWSAAQGRAGVVVVKTELTPELVDEGVARELIHHVQALRKDHDLPYEARITLTIDTADDGLKRVAGQFAATIRSECLAEEIEFGPVAGGDALKIEGRTARLAIAARGPAHK